VAVALAFIDCINRGDVDGLGWLMADEHALRVFDEPPIVGRAANVEAWRGYVDRFREYLVHPHRVAEDGDTVAVLGHTTGSHLGLPDEEECRLALIWVARIADGAVASWTLIDDSPANRRRLGLDAAGPSSR
jgi:ketosteroid isomerase-like protein